MDPHTGAAQQLTHGAFDTGPAFSPAGEWIAYTVFSAERSRLGFVPVPGTTPSFTPPAGLGADLPVDQDPSWQPLGGVG